MRPDPSVNDDVPTLTTTSTRPRLEGLDRVRAVADAPVPRVQTVRRASAARSDGSVALVLGTRPEIIKLAGISRLLGSAGYIIHSGQHYDATLSAAFFTTYGLPEPRVRLTGVGGASRAEQFAAVILQLGHQLERERPAAVVVQGDTNTAAAAAQAAHFAGIPVVHVEAGLRSFDRAMPEEINRRLIGVVADLHCAPTEVSAENLRREGVAAQAIRVTGNTTVDATIESLPEPARSAAVLGDLGLQSGEFVLATIHRPENTDDVGKLSSILESLAGLTLPVVLPLHPRTLACVERFGLRPLLDRIRTLEPIDHPVFLALAGHARLLVSDSGGVQEECTVLKRPLVVIRNSTERPEAIAAGFAVLVAADPGLAARLAAAVADDRWPADLAGRSSPFGDGRASERIAAAILELVDEGRQSSTAEP